MFRSLFSGVRTGKRHHAAGLRVEPLPDRLVPAAFAYDGATDTLTVEGDFWGADQVTILDHGDGSVTISDQTGVTATYEDVSRLVVETYYGDDAVRYKLDGTVVRDLDVDVRLDRGNDRFTGTLNSDISGGDRLRVRVDGGHGHDLITLYGTPTAPNRDGDSLTDGLAINDGGLRIGAGGELEANLLGGVDNDRIFVDYRGELDGTLDIYATGAFGDDLVSGVVRLQAGSTGQVGSADNPAVVSGWFGTDRLAFHVFDDSGNSRPVFAAIDGGEDWAWPFETDRGSRTANISHAGGVELLETI